MVYHNANVKITKIIYYFQSKYSFLTPGLGSAIFCSPALAAPLVALTTRGRHRIDDGADCPLQTDAESVMSSLMQDA